MDYPKVLISAPQSDKKRYCFDEWVENLEQLTYPNFTVFLVDNSDKNHFSKTINARGIKCEWLKPRFGMGQIEKIAKSSELIRQFALSNRFDYLFMLETDIFPPKDIIERLLTWRKSVVGATYHINHGARSEAMIQLVEENDSMYFKSTYNVEKTANMFCDGWLKQVYHVGLGAILIHKSVLKEFRFRWEEGKDMHPDSFFAYDLYSKGINIFADTHTLCRHENVAHGAYGIDYK